jgi:ABC-type transporter Mla subunit MlaD
MNVHQADFGDGAPPPDHNEMTVERAAEAAAEVIAEIEAEQAKVDEIMEAAKAKAASHRDSIAALKKQCRDEYNIEAKALGTVLAKRRQERRMTARIAALEPDAKKQFEQIELRFAE